MEKNKNLFRLLVSGGVSTGTDFILYIIISYKIDILIVRVIFLLFASII